MYQSAMIKDSLKSISKKIDDQNEIVLEVIGLLEKLSEAIKKIEQKEKNEQKNK
jgi:hypothetical protein